METNNLNLLPKFYLKNKMTKSGIAGIFAASLELTKEGVVKFPKIKMFDKLMIKRINMSNKKKNVI